MIWFYFCYNVDVDLDKLIKRAHTPNLKNHGIRRLGPTRRTFQWDTLYLRKVEPGPVFRHVSYISPIMPNSDLHLHNRRFQVHGTGHTGRGGTPWGGGRRRPPFFCQIGPFFYFYFLQLPSDSLG